MSARYLPKANRRGRTAERRIGWIAGVATLAVLLGSCVSPSKEPEAVAPPLPMRVVVVSDNAIQRVPRVPSATRIYGNDFDKCIACHTIRSEVNGAGPHLVNIYGREIASVANYRYSEALKMVEGRWDATTLDRFLENPREFAPGTKMYFNGLKDPLKRAQIIAFLQREARSNRRHPPIDLRQCAVLQVCHGHAHCIG
ncbi:MAG: hypothetical protein R3D99_07810 [Altererythrobacter sp.]